MQSALGPGTRATTGEGSQDAGHLRKEGGAAENRPCSPPPITHTCKRIHTHTHKQTHSHTLPPPLGCALEVTTAEQPRKTTFFFSENLEFKSPSVATSV